jgi:hypothetical protein
MDIKTRAINMVTKPAAEWPVVATESQTIESLIKNYAAPLAAIPALFGLVGTVILGTLIPFFGLAAIPVVAGVVGAVVQWVMALLGVFVCTLVVEFLAPKFNSTPNRVQAMKLVVFAMTPTWLAGVFRILPLLGGLISLVAAIYSIYVFYLGLTPVMNTPPSQVVPYMAICVLVMIVIFVVLSMLAVSVGLMVAGVGALAS